MKKLFLKISRISLSLFLVSLAIIIGFAMTTKSDEIELPFILGLCFAVTGAVLMICVVIAVILDVKETLEKDKRALLGNYVVCTLVLWLLAMGYEYFTNNHEVNVAHSLFRAGLVVLGGRAGGYIFAKQEKVE